jgi:hypothetical protein
MPLVPAQLTGVRGKELVAVERSTSDAHFYRGWILACVGGEPIGIGVAAGAAVAINVFVGEPHSLATRLLTLATFAVVGAVEGGALSVFQWRLLRTRLPRLRADEWVAGAAAGLCFGGAQWLVLRRHAQRAHRWIWIHIPAWGLVMTAIFLAATLPTPEWPAWTIALSGIAGGIGAGVLLGAVTGLVARSLEPWVDEQHWSLEGKVCAVTGANSGIGYETALGLARLHATVISCAVDRQKARLRERRFLPNGRMLTSTS